MLWQSLVNGIAAGSAYALVAIGFGLIFQVCRFFHLSHGAVIAAAAYFLYGLAVLLNWGFSVAVPVAIMGGAILGIAMEKSIYRPLRQLGASSVALLIVSMGLLIVAQNLISLTFGDGTKTLRVEGVREGFDVFGVRLTPIQVVTIMVSIVTSACLWACLQCTRWGKMTRAVATDSELGSIVGINRGRITLATFAAGSALAAVAGVLVAYDMDLTPTMGFRAIFVGVVAAIVGGVGNVLGAFLGGLLVGMAQHLGAWIFPT